MNDDIKIRNESRTLRYNRVSSIHQNLDRQQQNNQNDTYVFEDKCSGTIPKGKTHLKENKLHLFQRSNLGRYGL